MKTVNKFRILMTGFVVTALTIGVGHRALSAEETDALQEEAAAESGGEDGWIDELLTNELGYEADQIADFKSNVADLPEDQLRALVASMKSARTNAGQAANQQEHSRLAEHNRLISRLTEANHRAFQRPIRQMPMPVAQPWVRHEIRNPSRLSLFSGYSVWIWAR